jgi:hypothetical protein
VETGRQIRHSRVSSALIDPEAVIEYIERVLAVLGATAGGLQLREKSL